MHVSSKFQNFSRRFSNAWTVFGTMFSSNARKLGLLWLSKAAFFTCSNTTFGRDSWEMVSSEPRFTLQLFIWASANVEIISFYLLLHLQRVFVALFSERKDHNNNREPLPWLGMGISNRVFLYPYPTWILPLCLTLNFQKSFQNISKTNGCEAQKGYSKPIPQAMVNHCPPKKKLKGVKTPLL